VFLPSLLKPAATELRLLLWWLGQAKGEASAIPTPPPNGLTSCVADAAMPDGFYRMAGYRLCGRRAVRVDMIERLADMIRDRVFWKPRIPEEQRPAGSFEGGGFTIVADMMSLVGCSGEEFDEILRSLGFRSQKRKIDKAVTPAAAHEAAPAGDGAAPVVEPESSAPAEAVAPEAQQADPEPAPAGAAAPAPAAGTEKIEVDVWWPKDTGPFRAKPERAPKFNGAPKEKQGHKPDRARHDQKRHDQKPRADAKPKPERREKPLDPNSPFAKLAVLKEQMKGT
jgi:ATP-dependent RNA helicase SUPV3L1/SUV3